MRGLLEKCPVVLASATPAIETRQQVEIGRYREIKLPSRYGGAELPEIEAIDLTRDPPERGRWIAPKLVGAMDEVLEKGESSEERRVGKECVSTCRSRWSPSH